MALPVALECALAAAPWVTDRESDAEDEEVTTDLVAVVVLSSGGRPQADLLLVF